MGSLSAIYDNFFTPASYAFSIWGLIYLALIIQGAYWVFLYFKGSEIAFGTTTMSVWLSVHFFNMLWIYVWLSEQTALSVFVMILLLTALLFVAIRTDKIGIQKQAQWLYRFPVHLYTGWIIVALVANTSALLAKLEWSFIFSEVTWAILLLLISTGIYAILLWKRSWPILTYVGLWSLIAIAVKQNGNATDVHYTALGCTFLLIVFLISFYRNKPQRPNYS